MKKLLLILSAVVYSYSSLACTDIQLKTNDGAIIVGRTMEFGYNLDDQLVIEHKGSKHTSTSPYNNALTWVSKYDFAGLAPQKNIEVVYDGVNAKGLSIESLLFPKYAKYQQPTASAKNVLALGDLVSWILGNFDDVKSVRKALDKITVWSPIYAAFNNQIPPLHFVIHDRYGKSLVVEYQDGKLHMYNNQIGVMTNSPYYAAQLKNLEKYNNLSPYNAKHSTIVGQGSGSLGLPGDYTSPSRFVKVDFLLKSADPVINAASGVNLAMHVLNNVDIPLGVVRDKVGDNVISDQTEWSEIKDLTNMVIYIKTYSNMGYVKFNLMPLFNSTKPFKPLGVNELNKLEDADITSIILDKY